jgi:hypothetical protein
MAEAADRSRTAGSSETNSEPSAGPRHDSATGIVASLPATTPDVYRPLSLAAVIGFGLAILFSAYIAIFGLFTYFSGDFLIFPFWTILIPLGVATLCLVAKRTIATSEGTLTGDRLATWGLGLTVVFGLSYWSYFAATSLALRRQAATFVESKFLPALAKGNVDEAFVYTYKGQRPAINAQLHMFVERFMNVPISVKAMPPFTTFLNTEYVRLLALSGDKYQATLTATGTPVPEKGGEMQIPLVYHVETPLKSFDMQLVALASDVRSKEFSGRLWRVEKDKTWVVPQSGVWTAEGKRLFDKVEPNARQCLSSWVTKIANSTDVESAYQDTLPPAKRAAIIAKLKGKKEDELKKLKETDPELRDYFAGLQAYSEGSLVHMDKNVFWAPDAERDEFIGLIKKSFSSSPPSAHWMLVTRSLPGFEDDGKKVRFIYDVNLMLLPAFMGSGRVTVEADEDVFNNPAANYESWRVVGLELLQAHAAPQQGDETSKQTNPTTGQ